MASGTDAGRRPAEHGLVAPANHVRARATVTRGSGVQPLRCQAHRDRVTVAAKLEISGVFAIDDSEAFIAFLRSLTGVRVEVTPTRILVSKR